VSGGKAGRTIPVEREHGTPKGYKQHRYRGEVPCARCRGANSEDAKPRAEARHAALKRLAEKYSREFRALYAEEKRARGI
jgi:hypothetical protein